MDLKNQILQAFNVYAGEGVAALKAQFDGREAVLSHICLKFTDIDSFEKHVAEARDFGTVTVQAFKGKHIAWCKLKEPIEKDGMKLEWLEMVEPKTEKNAFNGVSSIGYCAESLKDLVKISSKDSAVLFRYQPRHVHP